MCYTIDTIYDICRHTISRTYSCFHRRHPLVPFTRCRPRSQLDAPPTICPSCAAIFYEADIDEYSASRIVGQYRRRDPYSDVLIPRLGDQGIRLMDRYGAVYGRIIPRGTVWVEAGRSRELEGARRRTRDLQQQIMEPERPLPQSIRPGSAFPARSPPRSRRLTRMQQETMEPERPLEEMIRPVSPSPPSPARSRSRGPTSRGRSPSPPRPRPRSRRPASGRGGYRPSDRHSSFF